MFQFTALSGAQSASRASQSILELDGGVKILVDVGWDARFDTRQLAELEKHVSTLSFVLLTHATLSHVGAYAHCCKHVPLFSQVPVYATAPVIAFGRTLLQDLYSSSPAAATCIPDSASPEDPQPVDDTTRSHILRDAPTYEEINSYFSIITPLKYSQPHQPNASYFSAPLEGLILTAYNAGHTLGGTIWHIQHGMESIVYAVDWHQGRENVIAGASWFDGLGGSDVSEALRKPTALVCSSVNGDTVAIAGGRKGRDETLLAHVRSTLSQGGSVLIPTDSSARILELGWLLEKVWQEAKEGDVVKTAKVYMATKAVNATLKHARSLIEWMDESIVREFEAEEEASNNATKTHKRTKSKQANDKMGTVRPFDLKHVRVVETDRKLDKVLRTEGPKVIIASDVSGEWGHSRRAIEALASNSANLIVLTEKNEVEDDRANVLGATLQRWHRERLNGVALEKAAGGQQIEQVHTGREITLKNASRVPLDDQELAKYQQYLATQRQIKESLLTNGNQQLAEAEDVMEDDETSSESEDEDDEQQGRALNVTAALTHGNKQRAALNDEDLGVSILLRKKDVYDFDVRNKKGRNCMFPYTHARKRGDEFGDFIKPEDFLREEEKEAAEALLEERTNNQLGQKRKWADEVQTKSKGGKRQKPDATQNGVGAASDEEDTDSEDETESELIEVQKPSKIVYEEKVVEFKARLAVVDFAGLHDQRSLQMLIPLIAPKKLILIQGSASETVLLAKDCTELLGGKTAGQSDARAEIYAPTMGERVDASVDTNAWSVKLTRDLVKRLHWQNVRNMSVVTVSGQLKVAPVSEDENVAKRQRLDKDTAETDQTETLSQSEQTEPVLDAVPFHTTVSTRQMAQPIHVGDLRLSDLRRLLRNSGHSAVFRGEGVLLVDDRVAVRKLPSGKVIVEGPPGSRANANFRANSFGSVKQFIYNGLAVLSSAT